MKSEVNFDDIKYNILKIMQTYPVYQYRQLMKSIPQQINISHSQWRKWLYLKKDSRYEIPHEQLNSIAQLLNVTIDDLINHKNHHSRKNSKL